jgi:methionine-rich copper-binding protein CopC
MNPRGAIGSLLAACLVIQAHAHAFLHHAEPRVGATVSTAPVEIRLWFSEELEPAFSTVKVLDSEGKRVDKADAHVDEAHREMLRVSLAPLRPGAYTVVWRVVSVDTHATQGDLLPREPVTTVAGLTIDVPWKQSLSFAWSTWWPAW